MNRFLFLLVAFISTTVYGTHIRGGEIVYIQDIDNHLSYQFTLIVYTDITSHVDDPQATLSFGDGNFKTVNRSQRISIGNKTYKNTYVFTHTYGGEGTYTVGYKEINRKSNILNIDYSENTTFFIVTELKCDDSRLNDSPKFYNSPLFFCEANKPFVFNLCAYDNDSLSFKKITPQSDFGLDVMNYKDPAQVANEPGSFEINKYTGEVIWDAPIVEGEYCVAFLVEEYRDGIKIGSVIKDYNIIVVSSVENSNHIFSIDSNQEINDKNQLPLDAGQNLELELMFSDNSFSVSSLECFSELLMEEYANYIVSDEELSGKKGVFTLAVNSTLKRNYPYIVIFRAVSEGPDYSIGRDITYALYIGTEIPLNKINPVIENILIFPNPIQSQIHLLNLPHGSYRFELSNLNGDIISDEPVDSNTPFVSMSTIPSGVYIYMIKNDDNVVISKGRIIK